MEDKLEYGEIKTVKITKGAIKKNMYFKFSCEQEGGNILVMRPKECMAWIYDDNDMEKINPNTYTITPIWLTKQEFDSLPEDDI